MQGRPAVFLDRDGTLIVERHYLADPDGVHLVPGAAEALAELSEAGFALVTVTNQSGIALGLYSEEDYHAVARRLEAVLEGAGVRVDATEYCPHHPEVSGPCRCRKPGTEMHRRAAARLGIDLEASYYVGDKLTDVLPAAELDGQGILVRTGYGTEHEGTEPPGTWVAADLAEATHLILARRR